MSNGYGRSTEGFGITRQQSVELIVKTALENGVTDPKQIAYILGTAQHETRNFNAPEEDFGRSQARKYGYGGGEEFFGRGYVHLTHKENYQLFDKKLGLNGELVRNPSLAMEPEIAAKIIVLGMRDGNFTGHNLDRHINDDKHDTYNARRIVNGVDKRQWTVQAAKDCQRYAEAWEKQVPDLIEQVRRSGIDFSKARDPNSAEGRQPSSSSVLKEGVNGDMVHDLQARLIALGYIGKDGKPLTTDGEFGANTKHAVEAFQKAHGLAVDGKAGKTTLAELASAKANPLVSETTHANHGLYTAIGQQLPAGTKADVVANVTLQALENGIEKPSDIRGVVVRGNDVTVVGNTPGFNAKVDLTAPTADLQAMSDHMAGQSRQATAQRSQEPALQQ